MKEAEARATKTGRKHNPVVKFFLKNSSLLYLLVLGTLAWIFVPRFGTLENVVLILRQSAVPIISCISMAFILVTCKVDLSTGYLVGLVSSACGVMLKDWGLGTFQTILLCIGIGVLAGAINGVLTAYAKIPAFITTLGSGLILFGLAQIVGGNKAINNLPEDFLAFGNKMILSFPVMVYYTLILTVILAIVMHRTVFGRELQNMGLNADACKLGGVKNQQIEMITFIISGAAAAFCSILMTIRVNCAQPDMGGGTFSFEAITAAVIGGTSLLGGKVNIFCCAVGAIIIKIIENCINLLNINYYMYQAVLGTVILAALIIESLKVKSES